MSDVRRLPVGEEDEGRVTLDGLAREGARRMIAAALEAEVDEYVWSFTEEVGEDGKRLVVRNGRARERRVTVGSGTVPVRAPRVNDKRVDEETGERKRFSSRILPAYARRSPKVTEVLPILYLHGLSTGDFGPALRDLLGEDASGLSSSSIQRLTEQLAGRARRVPHAGAAVPPLRVSVRRRRERQRPPRRGSQAVPAGGDRRPRGRREGAARGRGRLPRERGLVGGGVPRSARPRAERAEARDRRRRARRVGRAAQRVPRRQGAALLGAQDSERPRRAPEAAAAAREDAAARDGRGARAAQTLARRWSASGTSSTPSTRRPSRSSTRTGTRSPRSTTSPPSTGGTYAQRTRSRARSRPSSFAPRSPRAPAPRRPRSRWPTSCSTPPRSAGDDSTATSSSATCSPA